MTYDGRTQQQNTQSPIGAVMVVGGGIAGMQASLDLAEAGFKVYLVESKSAIGGHMAQLDKTFPTNDCAMCTISPKLVEAGRHLNVNILVDTEVLDVQGAAGNFTATLRRKPRYVDLSKCIGCGDCEKVCPVIVPDSFNGNLSNRRAAYRLYPQAIPSAYAIEKRGISPCRDACPVNTRAQGYIALVREGRYDDALRVIKEENPFPGICGRICNHRCETACNRNLIDEPIAIKDLKRFIVDQVYSKPRKPIERVPRTREERIAVIGSGPCGLTAAMDLVKQGYRVTVFESLPIAGGMLRVGVPEHRLPSWIVDREVQDIIDLGVEVRVNTTVNSLDDVFVEGFNAVLIAVGAHEGKKLPIPGTNLDGVLINTKFLRDVRLGLADNSSQIGDGSQRTAVHEQIRGRVVLVLGGGNVAIDVARTAVRLGAKKVKLACLESREKMPSHPWEIQEAEDEGIEMFPARSFTKILDDGHGRVAGVECVNVKFMEFDSEGRLNLETSEGSEHVIPCDTVIFSIGQAAGLAFLPADTGVGTTRRGTVAVNPNTLAATRPGVFAAGDAATGTAFVIDSVAAGHRVAESIQLYLQGKPLERPPRALDLPVVKLTRTEIDQRIGRGQVRVQPRVKMAEREAADRVKDFNEIALGYTEAEAKAEAARCLACGICSECLSCYYACGVGAIVHDMVERVEDIQVGAVILAPGYEVYRAELSEEFGFGRYPNVVTSLQFERLLSASGPTSGHVQRPSDGKPAHKIAFLQCVGSRDQSHDYCSAVCCMYAAKEAMIAKEHDPDADVHIFMMDARAFSKGYAEYYRRAQERYGVKYTRCRVSAIKEDSIDKHLIVRYLREDAAGSRLVEEDFDLAVLSVGMEISHQVRDLGAKLGIELDDYGFCKTIPFRPLETSRPGIFAAGPFIEPKDIPESVVDASGAAANAEALLAQVRGALARHREYPPERDVQGQAPRVGVFVCHCGSNIAGYLDVKAVAEYALALPNVVHAETNLYTCSQDSIARITEKVKELDLNRVVVASCTPRTHEPLFQDSIRAAGLNPYLFEMANIRNQCSWVHSHDRDAATHKAKDLVRMSAARVSRLEPLHKVAFQIERSALVLGGGIAGLNSALNLAEQGFPVHLVEQSAQLGGALAKSQSPRDAGAYLQDLIARVNANPLLHVHRETRLVETTGFVGNFSSRLRRANGEEQTVRHGAVIIATGAQEWRGDAHGLGRDSRIVTQSEFAERLAQAHDSNSQFPNSVVFIQCVGPAEKYCGRLCCTESLQNAMRLKELNPNAQITILTKDIRTYGFRERLYTDARAAGVIIVRYDDAHLPAVQTAESSLAVRLWEPTLHEEITLHPDVVVLATPLVPHPDARKLANILKVPVDTDGWFLEAHVKLRPVDFATEGIFLAGAAHYPKFANEAIAQAQAAASRAATILAKESLDAGGVVAQVDAARCTGCLTCVRICPYHVPRIDPKQAAVGGIYGAARIEAAACQGCGICAAECPAKAIQLLHFTDTQVVAKVDALFAGVPA